MKVYRIKRSQFLPITLGAAWKFFSSPRNLNLITPKHMRFRILYSSGDDELYPGQIIQYIVHVFPGLPIEWVTEITHVKEPCYFVDEQRSGPFRMWNHQHHFKEVDGGIEMTDEVNYAIPYSFIGRLANLMLVQNRLNAIFDYRFKLLEEYFINGKTNIRISA